MSILRRLKLLLSIIRGSLKSYDVSDVIAQIRIGFPDDFESSWNAWVVTVPKVPNGIENWIWIQYYAKTLYELGKCPASEGLKQDLEAWANKWGVRLLNHKRIPPAEKMEIDENLVFKEFPVIDEAYVIDILSGGGRSKGREIIQTYLAEEVHQNRMAFSVLALAHHFFAEADENFRKKLPLHILAMHAYYREKQDYDKVDSMLGASFFAIENEMRFQDEILQSAYDQL